ncbi:colanic acid biosynthesis glycosyltransferase WcaL [Labrys miyagiensis]|uniref:Colanic acid biosynthesis glycosyltransferase WcaL n=1 Tax=Labrys miyagiensis TaxID=346912 RepID=A0ABQ6CCX4_9HYPH|nr:glycosyltransferase family 4 protein [Labrys miyagiensis]GLS17527.1 colanic acid biosynthesis glycosyltransferase WcaL [Labrys miyagiensis]
MPPLRSPIAVVVKGYPRLSETFIAQEILALEKAGFTIEIWSLRHPTDGAVHMLNKQIKARPVYLPEYLYQAPWRVLAGALAALARPRLFRLLGLFLRDLRRDFSANRGRRLGQALVMARELDPAIRHIHVHYLHTPASVVRYAALLTRRTFSFSAHAKDIWTTTDWEKREKIADSAWGVTCTRAGVETLQKLAPPSDPDRVSLVYHGLDLARFPEPPRERPARDGRDGDDPVQLVTVGRAVAKKGFDDLLDALAELPAGLHWRLSHIGTGELRAALKAQAERLGLADRITWRGALAQDDVVAALRAADIFVLPCKEGEAGDRDGLPNVIMEAATQALPIASTRFAGVPEFVREGEEGLLVPPQDPAALSQALATLIGDPALRRKLGEAARRRVSEAFSFEAGIAVLADRLDAVLAGKGA